MLSTTMRVRIGWLRSSWFVVRIVGLGTSPQFESWRPGLAREVVSSKESFASSNSGKLINDRLEARLFEKPKIFVDLRRNVFRL